jgi:hypothetical protein
MDSSASKLCPSRCYSFFHSRTFNCTSKTTGWFTKGAEIDPNLPHANKSVTPARLYTLMDSFSRTKLCPSRCYLTFFHIPERSIALVKRLAGSPKGAEIDPNPTLTKVLQGSTHSYIHWWTSFSRTKLCPSRCYLTFFHIPERSIALVKRLAGSPKELKLIPTCPTLTKVLLQGSTRILIYIGLALYTVVCRTRGPDWGIPWVWTCFFPICYFIHTCFISSSRSFTPSHLNILPCGRIPSPPLIGAVVHAHFLHVIWLISPYLLPLIVHL